jgi:molybdopterin/thiamine biosynthesis adenylyltransferase/rhodanese-related sulfurtransferase
MSERYSRQIAVPEIGVSGQRRLAEAAVLVVGAGGLGSALLQYASAAGIGRLTIVDHDVIEESNLHRQPLYRLRDLGSSKAKVARDILRETNDQTYIESVGERLTPANVAGLVAEADIVVDTADSFAVTYTLSDECRRTSKILVSASVLALSGYVGAFCGGGASYRAVFPDMPSRAGTCAESGVLGTAVGVVGTLQAQLTLSCILDLQPSPLGRLVSMDFRSLRFGGFDFTGAREPDERAALGFISESQVSATDVVVDLRTTAEIAARPFTSTRHTVVDEIGSIRPALSRSHRVVLCCRSGARAWRAARILQSQGYENLALLALGQ